MERTMQKERIRKLETAKGRGEKKKREGGERRQRARKETLCWKRRTENGERRTCECKGETNEKEKTERQREDR